MGGDRATVTDPPSPGVPEGNGAKSLVVYLFISFVPGFCVCYVEPRSIFLDIYGNQFNNFLDNCGFFVGPFGDKIDKKINKIKKKIYR